MQGKEGFEGGMWPGSEGAFMGPEGQGEEEQQIETEATEVQEATASGEMVTEIPTETGEE